MDEDAVLDYNTDNTDYGAQTDDTDFFTDEEEEGAIDTAAFARSVNASAFHTSAEVCMSFSGVAWRQRLCPRPWHKAFSQGFPTARQCLKLQCTCCLKPALV